MTRFRRLLALPLATLLALVLAMPAAAAPKGGLERYARDTWRSFVHMVDPNTGLPADNIAGNLHPATRSEYTSPTNVGMYFWAVLAARDLGYIGADEAVDRISLALTTLEGLERHEPSGQFWNWYSPQTGEKLTVWPEPPHDRVFPFASSVDNGWLASALIMVANGVPELSERAWELATSMNFGCYYDPNAKADVGLIRGGFWLPDDAPPNHGPIDDYCDMGEDEEVAYTGHHYGAFNTEPRIASYIGIALGQIPAEHYFGGWRTFPDTCDWSWPETRPIGVWRNYMGVDVFEGAYPFDDQLVVPTWGGSMFEALMVPLVVPEEEWGPRSWGETHPLYVESQIEYGLDPEHANYGYWGFSPSSNPAGGYREYGVDAIGMEPNGYTSDVEKLTLVDNGWDDPADVCDRPPDPIEDYGEGVVTPHAAFLALDFDRAATLENLANLAADFAGLYGRGGFKDAVNVETGEIADRYLALDQGMVLAAIANEVLDDQLQEYMAVTLEPSLRPLMVMEEFGAGRMAP
jgi:hypothetical protein